MVGWETSRHIFIQSGCSKTYCDSLARVFPRLERAPHQISLRYDWLIWSFASIATCRRHLGRRSGSGSKLSAIKGSKPKTLERRFLEFLQISTSVMRETNAAQMLYVTIFMDHTIALVKKVIMEMAKTAEVRLPHFSSFPLVLFAESTWDYCLNWLQMESLTWKSTAVNGSFIIRFALNRKNLKHLA